MCVLTREVILREIRDGNIVIDPFDESLVGPGSVDLHLSNEIRTFLPKSEIYHVTDEPDFEQMTVRRVYIGGRWLEPEAIKLEYALIRKLFVRLITGL